MHRDVRFALDLLDKIHLAEDWLRTHLPDLHEIGYGQASSSDGDHVQQSGTHDLSSRIGTSPQHAWHSTARALKAALLELQRAEYATSEQFTAGTTPEPDRPGRDTTMPPRIAKQVHAAAARRRARGEYTPERLGDTLP